MIFQGVSHQSCLQSTCQNKRCETAPCRHGGTCREVCDVNSRRFQCTCPPGYTGHSCQVALLPRSCKDVTTFKQVKTNGIYNIVDQQNTSIPVYCDFGSEPGVAWTLIQSHSLQNNDAFRDKAFYLHDVPINQDAPEWNNYRLSMSRMKSIRNVSTHWRATCNFLTDGIDHRDYIRSSFDENDLFAVPVCCTWSHSFQNNDAFKSKAFYLHDMPVNQDVPEWNNYRLSMSRMKSIQDVSTHWRATCNFPTTGVDYRDYWRVSLKNLDLFVEPAADEFCLSSEFVNIRGNECANCTVWTAYSQVYSLHIDSWFSQERGCEFNGKAGGIGNEDNFGFYGSPNTAFRCTSSSSSTSQFWLGSF